MKHSKYSKKRLAVCISAILATGLSHQLYAQETEQLSKKDKENEIEIIEVTGIMSSLTRSMALKRDASGVMDVISAEDMGKFPDTNLAESLQRITGVSVSRSNGEGSQITVRGFGPDFNLITLNGRQMPGTGNSRSYSLENLSSDGVSSLEVHKTSRAENPSGGLGATVNIVTMKPFQSPGEKLVLSGKGIFDSSNEEGDDLTPEFSGLYSNTYADDTLGFSIAFSHQERDFQQQAANIQGWQFQSDSQLPSLDADNIVDNRDANAAAGAFFPRDMNYGIANIERERTNANVTFQYAPIDSLILTLDYTMGQSITGRNSIGWGQWHDYGGNIKAYELDENGTALRFTETANDYAHSANVETLLVESESVGFNFEWQITDEFHFELDYHDSDSTTDNGADDGVGHSGNVILAPNNIVTKTYDFSQGGVPQFDITWPGGAAEASPGDFDPLFAQFGRAVGESSVEQLQIDTEWVNPDDSFLTKVKFGLADTAQTFGGYSANNGNVGPNGYNGNQAVFPDSMFTRQDTGDFLDALDGGGSDLTTNYYYLFDYAETVARLANFFDSFPVDPFDTDLSSTSSGGVTEETSSIYVQTALYQ